MKTAFANIYIHIVSREKVVYANRYEVIQT